MPETCFSSVKCTRHTLWPQSYKKCFYHLTLLSKMFVYDWLIYKTLKYLLISINPVSLCNKHQLFILFNKAGFPFISLKFFSFGVFCSSNFRQSNNVIKLNNDGDSVLAFDITCYLYVCCITQLFVTPAGEFEPAHSCRLSAPCLPADRPAHREGDPTQCSWGPNTSGAGKTVLASYHQK